MPENSPLCAVLQELCCSRCAEAGAAHLKTATDLLSIPPEIHSAYEEVLAGDLARLKKNSGQTKSHLIDGLKAVLAGYMTVPGVYNNTAYVLFLVVYARLRGILFLSQKDAIQVITSLSQRFTPSYQGLDREGLAGFCYDRTVDLFRVYGGHSACCGEQRIFDQELFLNSVEIIAEEGGTLHPCKVVMLLAAVQRAGWKASNAKDLIQLFGAPRIDDAIEFMNSGFADNKIRRELMRSPETVRYRTVHELLELLREWKEQRRSAGFTSFAHSRLG